MIDIHTHILPGVDDGAKELNESLEIAREAERQGVTTIVATPHYMEEGYGISPSETKQQVAELQAEIERAGIDVRVLSGAEVYIMPNLAKRVKEGMVTTINDSSYILIEFPMTKIPDYTDDLLYDLKVMGYTPIIAHPERYKEIQTDPNRLYYWIKSGVLAQLNAGSLLGAFGSKVKETAELLVDLNMVQLIASDLHSNTRRRECLEDGFTKLEGRIAHRAELYLQNAEAVINNDNVRVNGLCKYEKRRGFFDRLKRKLSFG
ncbi:protein-tyrosine phosphatase [Orenia metallireducens]|uniref:protein-tyrosine-phosphatase n=1 Tax=Orenia metallireducens TaxID=1413210 RepID=A0A285FWP9_9FIRM|nr:CpsB/CapC family capsule biosynthesis tyrosine phosphatase [Orenia metallireducens]PRX35687.1 protein-tyrosine phosphatase [Orenia metallireducens]SNY15244.1 protein-tyrosine phosphatase [Orenia metallireducens]